MYSLTLQQGTANHTNTPLLTPNFLFFYYYFFNFFVKTVKRYSKICKIKDITNKSLLKMPKAKSMGTRSISTTNTTAGKKTMKEN